MGRLELLGIDNLVTLYAINDGNSPYVPYNTSTCPTAAAVALSATGSGVIERVSRVESGPGPICFLNFPCLARRHGTWQQLTASLIAGDPHWAPRQALAH